MYVIAAVIKRLTYDEVLLLVGNSDSVYGVEREGTGLAFVTLKQKHKLFVDPN